MRWMSLRAANRRLGRRAWRDGGAAAAEVEAVPAFKPLPLVHSGILGELDALLVNDMLEEDAELPLA